MHPVSDSNRDELALAVFKISHRHECQSAHRKKIGRAPCILLFFPLYPQSHVPELRALHPDTAATPMRGWAACSVSGCSSAW